jgi:hypothetical protein
VFLVQRLLDSQRYLLARNNQRLMGLLADEDLRVVILIPSPLGGFRNSPSPFTSLEIPPIQKWPMAETDTVFNRIMSGDAHARLQLFLSESD